MDRRIREPNKTFPGRELTLEEKQEYLYHYTTLESFLKIWVTKALLFSNASNMNDILESHKSLWIKAMSKEIFQRYSEIVYSYKQISLTMDYDSYLMGCMSRMMWGHYGQKGDGVCIELDKSKLKLENTLSGPVNYSVFPPSLPVLPIEVQTDEQINDFVKKNKEIFFFTKTEDWAGENEYRILSNTINKLDISEAITGIYVTSADSLTCQCVETLVRDEVPVRFFHHNITKKMQKPLVTSTVLYRKSSDPKPKTTNTVVSGFAVFTLTEKKSDGTIEEQILSGEASLVKKAETEEPNSTNPSKQ